MVSGKGNNPGKSNLILGPNSKVLNVRWFVLSSKIFGCDSNPPPNDKVIFSAPLNRFLFV